MSISVIIIDDEPLAIAELREMLNGFEGLEIVGQAVNAEEAKLAIERHHPQLIFLDINMPGKSGFELLEELTDVPEVIFVTAYDTFAIRAFEVNALDYLLKPANPERLAEAIEKVRKRIGQGTVKVKELTMDKRIFIKDGEDCHFVPLQEIFQIESVGNYARVFYKNEKPLLHKSLNYLEEKLPDDFFRASRQVIFNINFIRNIAPYFNSTLQIELFNGIKIDISQRQSVKFKEKMGI